MSPYIDYALTKGGYEVSGENISGQEFLFQVAGPKSLQILDKASGENLHDIAFLSHRPASIVGHEVRILRLGMAGSLAYEVHGPIEAAHDVYNAIWAAGEPAGMLKLGTRAYMMNHTEDGFPQAYYHFPYAWATDPAFAGMIEHLHWFGGISSYTVFKGSMEPAPDMLYRTPVDLGWEGAIKFDHDFPGRNALEKLAANPPRRMVTLEWNKDDIVDVYASQFGPGESYKVMDATNDFFAWTFHADRVVNAKGELIGVSSGRSLSQKYRTMISLCSIDTQYAELGTEVAVVWGEPGTRQKHVRAVVTRFPFMNEDRNETVDTAAIPYGQE